MSLPLELTSARFKSHLRGFKRWLKRSSAMVERVVHRESAAAKHSSTLDRCGLHTLDEPFRELAVIIDWSRSSALTPLRFYQLDNEGPTCKASCL